jgi:CCR4-NOT complex subunit CAF16
MKEGRLVEYRSVDGIADSLETFAQKFMDKTPVRPFEAHSGISSQIHQSPFANEVPPKPNRLPCVVCRGLTYKNVFENLSFTIFTGSRTLLLGCNGSGKSTLLNMLGGKQFFNNSGKNVQILGKNCYDDMTLNDSVTYCGDWWIKPPACEVYVREMVPVDPPTPRTQLLLKMLDVDVNWDIRLISQGEQKRVQLLHRLHCDRPVVLLDEATADLDVDQRHALLRFLYMESASRGVTVVYATHILEGLNGWATDLMVLDCVTKGVHTTMSVSDSDVIDLADSAKLLMELKQSES